MGSIRLVGDIGGTKTTLAIVDSEVGSNQFLDKATFVSRNYPSLEAIVKLFLKGKKWAPTLASFGVAGPVFNGQVQATNLPWFIEESSLNNAFGIPIRLINDLFATAHAVPFLSENDLVVLNPGKTVDHGSLAVIAPGTGLGEAYLHWVDNRYRTFPSEGGHTDFAPTDQLQIKLLQHLQARIGHVSYEGVCSGKGLPNIYSFLKEEGVYKEPDWLNDLISQASDPTPAITKAALEETAEIAVATLNIFISILGSESGNLALKTLATGGVYIGGGIPPRINPLLRKESFLRAFQNKGRFSDFLKTVPIYVINNPEAALIGAACHGMEMEQNCDYRTDPCK
jgi:glucokinase